MHKYIDVKILHDFKKQKTLDDVITDIMDIYKIQNISNDDNESVYYICKALYDDYAMQRANYTSYIEKEMDARVLMELRKSAVLPMDIDLYDFYSKHCECENQADIKQFRTQYLKFLNEDYADLDWQYYYLVKNTLKRKSKGFFFDYETCFADGDYKKQSSIEDYKIAFINAHTIN